MIALGAASARLATLAERGFARGRDSWHALQVSAAIAIGQIGPTADVGRPTRELYPIVRLAESEHSGFDPRERVDGLILTEPHAVSVHGFRHSGMPGDAPN